MTNLDVDPNADFDASSSTVPEVEQKPEVRAPASIVLPTPPSARVQSLPLAARDNGLLIGSTLEEQFRLATAYCRSGLMPRGLDTPEKVLVGLQLCRELNLPTITSIGKIMVMNGTPSIHSDLPLALVRRSGKLKKIIEEWLRDGSGKIIGGKCTVERNGEEEVVVREFTIDDAKIAGLWGKTNLNGKPSPWVLYPARMLQMRARSWALKDKFTDVLFGVSILEYDHNAIVEGGVLIGGEVESRLNGAAKAYKDAYLNETEADQGRVPAQGNTE